MKRTIYCAGLAVLSFLTAFSHMARAEFIEQISAPQCVTPPSGITAWWPAEGNANDTVNGNNGSPVGAVNYTNGVVGDAFVFDGSTSYISIPASPTLDIGSGNGLTIECWINPDYDTGGSMPIIEWDSTDTDGLQIFCENQHTLYANLRDTGGNDHQLFSPAFALTNNVWQHVALTYDKTSGAAMLYINGTMVTSNNFGNITPQTSYPLNIGRRTAQVTGFNETFNGFVDEMSLYARALNPSEILGIFNAGNNGKCSTPIPASIVVPPASQTVEEGSSLTLTTVASGSAPLRYQWLYANGPITGATNSTLTLNDFHPYQAGNYAVVVANDFGTVTSAVAAVSVTVLEVLAYTYTGKEAVTSKGVNLDYKFTGELFFLPATTNGTFVGWATIQGKKQYWTSVVSDDLVVTIPATGGQSYTVFGKAGSDIDSSGFTHIWSYLHVGKNDSLSLGGHNHFTFPKTMDGGGTRVYPNSQTSDMILDQSDSKYVFSDKDTQDANNGGQTMADLVNALTAKLRLEKYQLQP